MKAKIRQFWQQQEGVVAPLVAILLVFGIIVGILALVLDLGHMHNVKSELQKAADACALRGARAFFPDDRSMATMQNFSDIRARDQAIETITRNYSDFKQLTDLPAEKIEVGIWDFQKGDFSSIHQVGSDWWKPLDPSLLGKYVGPGIRLPVLREQDYNQGPVRMTLASIFRESMDAGAWAAAALSAPGEVEKGVVDLPIAVFVEWLRNIEKNKSYSIDLNPTTGQNAMWFVPPNEKNVNTKLLADYILGRGKEFPSFDTDTSNDNLDPNNPLITYIDIDQGNKAALFQEQTTPIRGNQGNGALYWKWWLETGRYGSGGIATKQWIVQLPIISNPDNSSGTKQILGFSSWSVDYVRSPSQEPPGKIRLTLVDWVIPSGKGGGVYGGTLVPDPKLTQ